MKSFQKIKLLEDTRNKKTINTLDAFEIIAPIFPVSLYWHDTTGAVIGANEQCLIIMDRTAKEVLHKTPYDFYFKETADHIWKHSEQVIKSGKTLTQEEYAHDRLGNRIATCLSIKSPLYDGRGNIIGIIGTSIDVTTEKEAIRLKFEAQQAEIKAQAEVKDCLDAILNNIHSYQRNSLNKALGKEKFNSEIHLSLPENKIKLSKRESQVLYYLSLNKVPKDIATILTILDEKEIAAKSVQAIIDHQLYNKFDVYSVSQLIEKATLLKKIPFMPN